MKTVTRTVWIYLYSPFRLGATNGCNVPTGTKIVNYKIINLGRGFKGILFENYITGSWHIADKISGAIVGTRNTKDEVIEMVTNDVKLAKSIKGMREQVNRAIEVTARCGIDMLSIDEFFKGFN